jgi:RNA polymerase sigma-70 factor (ECF subfamily)
VRDRDEEDFRVLYRRHTPVLFRLALRLLGDEAAAEDAVQEAWIRAAEKLAAFRFESALRTWLVGILLNCVREARRRRGPASRPGADLPVDETELGDAAGSAPLVAEAIDLERAIGGLPDGYRQVFVCHDLLGHTHREIAALLGVDEGTSKSQLFLARRALRRRLGSITRGSP